MEPRGRFSLGLNRLLSYVKLVVMLRRRWLTSSATEDAHFYVIFLSGNAAFETHRSGFSFFHNAFTQLLLQN